MGAAGELGMRARGPQPTEGSREVPGQGGVHGVAYGVADERRNLGWEPATIRVDAGDVRRAEGLEAVEAGPKHVAARGHLELALNLVDRAGVSAEEAWSTNDKLPVTEHVCRGNGGDGDVAVRW